MSLKRALRIAVCSMWMMIVPYVAASFLLEDTLPSPLREYVAAEAEREIGAGEIAVILAGLPLLIAMVAASIGLLLLRRWAAWLFLGTMVCSIPLTIAMGPTVEPALASAFRYVLEVLSGVILGIAFFTDALRPPRPVPEARASDSGMPSAG